MSILLDVENQSKNVDNMYPHKKILFIGSESYDAATITTLEGLYGLGFVIFTYKKPNINSWFCNTVIQSLAEITLKIDFVLSNMHWGVKWSLYDHIPKTIKRVLIDGCDGC